MAWESNRKLIPEQKLFPGVLVCVGLTDLMADKCLPKRISSIFLIENFIKVYGVCATSCFPRRWKFLRRICKNIQNGRDVYQNGKSLPFVVVVGGSHIKKEEEIVQCINTWQHFHQRAASRKCFWHLNILWYHSLNKSFPFGCVVSNAKWFTAMLAPC